jgi:hypothetical protein
VLELRLSRYGIDHRIGESADARIGRECAVPVDRREHHAGRHLATHANPHDHGSPGRPHARELSGAHRETQGVSRVHFDERFIDMRG